MGKPFVHLHVHTTYSKLDGMTRMDDNVRLAKEDGAPAAAASDHGTMGGMIKLFMACKKYGIKPIPAVEAYHVDNIEDRKTNRGGEKNIYHLLMIATSNKGYRNLMAMQAAGYNEGFFNGKPRIDPGIMKRYSEDVIVTTGCLGGKVSQRLLNEDWEGAVAATQELVDIFGKDNVFVEIQNHGIDEQLDILDDQVRLAEEMGLQLVATNDSHYTHKSEHDVHDSLLAINTGNRKDDPDRSLKFTGQEHYIKSAKEMWELFPEDKYPGACENTLKIAERVNVDMPFDGLTHHLPEYPHLGGMTNDDKLRELTLKGAASPKKYGDEDGNIDPKAMERLEHELKIITSMGFSSYFLVVMRILELIRNGGYRTGPGRGSGAGSAVAYCLDITGIEPMRFGLIFERFLNPGRTDSPPDFDTDVESDGRAFMMQEVAKEFGADQAAQIAAYGTIKVKSALKDAARILGFPASVGQELSNAAGNAGLSIKDALGPRPPKKIDGRDNGEKVRDWDDMYGLRSCYELPDYTKIIDTAADLEGAIRQWGIHAGGVAISPGPMWDFVPIHREAKDDSSTLMRTEFDKGDVERAGIVKIDMLGLANLTTIRLCLDVIKRDLGEEVDIDNIPLDDEATLDIYRSGDTSAIFQVEGQGLTDLLIRMQPKTFEDIAAATALYRPGPMGVRAHEKYADRANGRERVEKIHPIVDEILSETYGLIVYQEQVMAIAQRMAGFDAKGADDFRKAMGKKDRRVLEMQAEKWFAGFKANGHPQSLAQSLWDTIEPFAEYAFNKSHSVAYGLISFQTAYLKAHYRTQFLAACIDTMSGDRVPAQVEAARRQGAKVYSPDINRSGFGATTSRDSIWLGASGIKSLGTSALQEIISERDSGGPFKSVEDFALRVAHRGVNKRHVENLAAAGAFDSLRASRKKVYESASDLLNTAKSIGSSKSDDFDLFGMEDELENLGSVMDGFDLTGSDWDDQQALEYEREVLGFFASKHPWSIHKSKVLASVKSSAIPAGSEDLTAGAKYDVYGIMLDRSTKPAGSTYLSKFRLETGPGESTDVIRFGPPVPESYVGKPVLVSGAWEEDSYGEEGQMRIKAVDVKLIETNKGNDEDEDERPRGRRRSPSRPSRSGRSSEPAPREKQPQPEAVSKPDQKQDRPARRFNVIQGEGGDETPSRRPRGRRSPDSNVTEIVSEESYVFRVKDDDQMVALRDALLKHGKGSTPVIIEYLGQRVSHDALKFNLALSDIRDIELETGATLVD